jgi:hypothetical protein
MQFLPFLERVTPAREAILKPTPGQLAGNATNATAQIHAKEVTKCQDVVQAIAFVRAPHCLVWFMLENRIHVILGTGTGYQQASSVQIFLKPLEPFLKVYHISARQYGPRELYFCPAYFDYMFFSSVLRAWSHVSVSQNCNWLVLYNGSVCCIYSL